ncbi:hypothetical protein CMUS01_06376 [Colletotrichum musicola]|uniref:Uncharacterized protein n=1 Tax=Colletotrichum musicola TaxID=2175873 RepID=A0A8H6KMM6_9PEZI|nr:hypothetical protein CMUS01_06376 [Colletotrichum musicola]
MEAAGLASSILAFIEVSYKITKGAHEIYTSVSGSTEEHAHVVSPSTEVMCFVEASMGSERPPAPLDLLPFLQVD